MQIAKVQAALKARGVELCNSATSDSLGEFEAQLGLRLDSEVRQLYLHFDGFVSYDSKSQMALWPLHRIVQNKSLSCEMRSQRWFAIGDFLIDADFLMCCPTNGSAPVFLLYEGRELASSVSDFLEKLVCGGFDFLN
jgi:hypothetical protein